MPPKNETRSATDPDQRHQSNHVAEHDRGASRGAEFAHDNNASAEGNDAALTAGPAFVRRVNADGTVEAVPATPKTDDDHASADAADATSGQDTGTR